MKGKSIITGKLKAIPSKSEGREIRKKKLAAKRRQLKRDKGEDAQEKKLQAKSDKRSGRDKFISTAVLQKSSTELLQQVMAERKIPIIKNGVLDAVVKAKLGKQFARETRADKHKILAVGCAVYHELATQRNPVEALHRLAESVGVEVSRINNPCRIIVECLVNYGAKGRSDDRQYPARDARALSYIIRTGMSPQEVMTPGKGETITAWAKREADYRSSQKSASNARKKQREKPVGGDVLQGHLPLFSLAQAAYNAITGMSDSGVVVVKPKGGGDPLALTITPLTDLTVKRAVSKPGKVRAAIRKTLEKSRQMTSGTAAKDMSE
ncbi:hypothetical protein AMST5_03381 [freshwater sediment metagenome]|uniref:Uncharacterized protein n=1 Tax=freshwater sediment metagenome TaxID=556182 RepID=A0AA48REI4_9ZZZZ